MEDPQVNASIAELLVDAGLDTGDCRRDQAGGGSNQVFVVRAGDFKYREFITATRRFQAQSTRCGYAFLSYARNIGLRCVPKYFLQFENKHQPVPVHRRQRVERFRVEFRAVRQAARFLTSICGES
jgi:hypothetical protein